MCCGLPSARPAVLSMACLSLHTIFSCSSCCSLTSPLHEPVQGRLLPCPLNDSHIPVFPSHPLRFSAQYDHTRLCVSVEILPHGSTEMVIIWLPCPMVPRNICSSQWEKGGAGTVASSWCSSVVWQELFFSCTVGCSQGIASSLSCVVVFDLIFLWCWLHSSQVNAVPWFWALCSLHCQHVEPIESWLGTLSGEGLVRHWTVFLWQSGEFNSFLCTLSDEGPMRHWTVCFPVVVWGV